MLVWVYVSVGRGAELSKTRDLLLLRAEFGVTLCLDIMARWQSLGQAENVEYVIVWVVVLS